MGALKGRGTWLATRVVSGSKYQVAGGEGQVGPGVALA